MEAGQLKAPTTCQQDMAVTTMTIALDQVESERDVLGPGVFDFQALMRTKFLLASMTEQRSPERGDLFAMAEIQYLAPRLISL